MKLDPENTLIMKLKQGDVIIQLYPDLAPKHVARIKALARAHQYDSVAFHRVIPGFMAQTGDIQYGKRDTLNPSRVGTGGSDLEDLPAEFNSTAHTRGTVSMARSMDPNSANSQFFICFGDTPHLDGQYTAFGKVIQGMEWVDKLNAGDDRNGSVAQPDFIEKFYVLADEKETANKLAQNDQG